MIADIPTKTSENITIDNHSFINKFNLLTLKHYQNGKE